MIRKTGSLPEVFVYHLDKPAAQDIFHRLIVDFWQHLDADRIERVIVKINLCEYRRPESGAVTDPDFLASLIRALKTQGTNLPIYIAEVDATSIDADSAFRYMSIDRVAADTGSNLLNLSKTSWHTVTLGQGLVFKEMYVPDILDSGTLYVNFSKLKINSGSKITGCLKNNYALIRDKNKAKYHHVVHEAIHDINLALAQTDMQTMNIIEGYIGMETIGGPAFGKPIKSELVIASTDPVAVDACEARVIGFSPHSVRHIALCSRSGLGCSDYLLRTDIPDFNYNNYRFRFQRLEYWLRQIVKNRVGMGI